MGNNRNDTIKIKGFNDGGHRRQLNLLAISDDNTDGANNTTDEFATKPKKFGGKKCAKRRQVVSTARIIDISTY